MNPTLFFSIFFPGIEGTKDRQGYADDVCVWELVVGAGIMRGLVIWQTISIQKEACAIH